jgi:hypothetical protein
MIPINDIDPSPIPDLGWVGCRRKSVRNRKIATRDLSLTRARYDFPVRGPVGWLGIPPSPNGQRLALFPSDTFAATHPLS